MSETSELTGPILKAMKQAGYLAIRMQSGRVKVRGGWMNLAPPGTADIVIFRPYKEPVWAETKTAKGRTNPEQIKAQGEFRDRVAALGHIYVKAMCLDDVLAVL